MTREDLKGLRYSQEWVEEQIERYEEQRALVLKITKDIDGMPKAQNKQNYGLEELLDQYNELLKILANEQKEVNKIILQINKLNPLYKIILTKRYIENKDFVTIASEIHYNYYDTCKLHGKALNEFDKLHKKPQDFPNNNVLL